MHVSIFSSVKFNTKYSIYYRLEKSGSFKISLHSQHNAANSRRVSPINRSLRVCVLLTLSRGDKWGKGTDGLRNRNCGSFHILDSGCEFNDLRPKGNDHQRVFLLSRLCFSFAYNREKERNRMNYGQRENK